MSADNPTCARCGADLPAEARFCPGCGQTVAAAAAVPPPPPPRAAAPPPPPPAAAVLAPPPCQAPVAKRSDSTAIALFIIGLAVAGMVAVAGIAAWMTLGQRVSKTVTVATSHLPVAPPTGESAPPAIEVGDSTKPDEPPSATPVEQVSLAGVGEGEHVGPVSSGDQAAALVLAMPDVEAWSALVKKAAAEGKKRRALVTVEVEPSGDYLVHVFESVEDEDPGHTATFGWFKVNHETGAIKSDTPDSD